MEEEKITGYPSIDKPWLKYYTEEAINAPLPECTVYEHVLKNNGNHLPCLLRIILKFPHQILLYLQESI